MVPIYPRNNTIIEPIVQGGVYMNMGKPSLDIITSMGDGSRGVLRISFIISSNFSEMFRIFTTLGVLFISNCILFSAGSKIPGQILFFPITQKSVVLPMPITLIISMI